MENWKTMEIQGEILMCCTLIQFKSNYMPLVDFV